MPSDLSYWMVSVPLQDGDPHRMMSELSSTLISSSSSGSSSQPSFGQLNLPPLKTGTLDSLISLSDDLPKFDSTFTSIVAKIHETLRSLLNDDENALAQHCLVNERTIDDYMMDWAWSTSKYRTDRSIKEVVEALNKEMTSIDNVLKQKLNNYNLAKGQLQGLQRKKTGNLSIRSLADVVHKEDFVDQGSEYLETLLVAVPRNNAKDWVAKYERLTSMVVPRSSHKITQDDEYALFNVTVFKKVRDEFVQKCRENKFHVREFAWDDQLVEKQRQELEEAGTSEKELWTELLRLSRTSFSEAYQGLTHLKVVRTFAESVLRFGLPADYFGITIKPNPKRTKVLLMTLNKHFEYLSTSPEKRKAITETDAPGEFQSLLDEETYPFVLMENYMVSI